MNTITPVRVGLVGVANHGGTILNAIVESGTLVLHSCFDINPVALETVARKHHARAATSYDDLVDDAELDAVALVTPNHLHLDQVRKAAAAGKHLFVEKPIANTVAEGKEILRLAEEAQRVLLIGHNTRRRQVFRKAKDLLDGGVIGKVVAVEGNLSRPAGLQPGLPHWKADPRTCPLLPMMQLGIHLIDTVEYLLGPVKAVGCIAANIAMPGSVFDSTAALLQLESGVPCSLTSYYVTPDAYFLRIYGTAGLMHCDPTHLRVEILKDGTIVETRNEDFPAEGARSYMLQMREFGECITAGRTPETDGAGALRALAAVEAMALSVDTGRTIAIEEILLH